MTSLNLTPRRTALVLIDLQHWIMAMTPAPHASATVLAHALELARAVRAGGGQIVLVRVAFSPGFADRLRLPVDQDFAPPAGGLPEGAYDFPPELAQLGADVVITKRQWSAFHGTELDLQLRRRGLDTIVLGGISTNFGVESTARDAWQHNYAVVVAEDACSSREAAMHRFAIEQILPRVARVRSTAEIVAALGRAPG